MIRLFPGLKRLLESVDRERFTEPRLCIKPDIKKIVKIQNGPNTFKRRLS